MRTLIPDGWAMPVIPNGMYKLLSGYIWKQSEKHYSVQKELIRQPYL